MKNLRITNEDFFNYIQSLTTSQLKGLNYKLENVKPMEISTGVNGDSYKSFLVRVEKKGRTLIVKKEGKYAEEETYTYKPKRARYGGVNFNTHTDHLVREI